MTTLPTFHIVLTHTKGKWNWYTINSEGEIDLQGMTTHNSHITAWSDAWEHINMRYNPELLMGE
jgi:hypothetical protein